MDFEEAKPQAPLLTVVELAAKHGQTRSYIADRESHPFTARHLVADARHGWQLWSTRNGDQLVTLSDDDYLAALAAAHEGNIYAPANRREPRETPKEETKKSKKKGGA